MKQILVSACSSCPYATEEVYIRPRHSKSSLAFGNNQNMTMHLLFCDHPKIKGSLIPVTTVKTGISIPDFCPLEYKND